MNTKLRVGMGLVALLVMLLAFVSFANAMDDSGFAVNRMVVCTSIVDREPVASGEVFPAATEELYCYLDAREIKEDTTVSFVWFHESEEMARIELPLREGGRWRTWTSKKINGLTGNWKVELQDPEGTVHGTVAFYVE